MARKVFLSFLGITDYRPIRYYFEDQDNTDQFEVRFVQESVLKYYKEELDQEDQVFIFTTKRAKAENWENFVRANKDTSEKILQTGLRKRLEMLNLLCPFTAVDIPDGNSQEEFWKIFTVVFERLQDHDELIFDVTHAFRALPMLNLVLLHYAKALKSVNIRAIHYGNYESRTDLGAPIWDLKPLVTLLDWTFAANSFVKFGLTEDLFYVIKDITAPRRKASQGKDAPAVAQEKIANRLHEIGMMITTNRGNEIQSGSAFQSLHQGIQDLQNEQDLIPPLAPLFHHISSKVMPFCNDKIPNWLAGVKWCIDHGLIQQGITQLQEGIISQICSLFPDFLNTQSYDDREIVKNCIQYLAASDDKKRVWKWRIPLKSTLAQRLINSEHVQFLAGPFERLTQSRNDINHGGYLGESRQSKVFTKELSEIYTEIYTLLTSSI